MTIAICLDDDNGILFNGRRQSRDRVLINDLINSAAADQMIWIHPYSLPLFQEFADRVRVDEDYLHRAADTDICFVEREKLSGMQDRIDGWIVYRWNRRYPSDNKLTTELDGYRKTAERDFAGSSHERITREEYSR